MKSYKENDCVIYTDKKGNRIDTFVIFDTDPQTGLTHINHLNLKVSSSAIELHPRSITGNAMPMSDYSSFELFNKLKEKYTNLDQNKKATPLTVYRDIAHTGSLAKAS